MSKVSIYGKPTSAPSVPFPGKKNPSDIYIWLRSDATLTNIVEAILTSITRHDVYKNLNFTWSESEAVVDWLLTYSPIAQLLKTIDPGYTQGLTLKNTRAFQSGTLIQKSQAFLTRDEIADLIFGSQSETFSLYAVSKSIQRLRDRLEKNGISGSFIQTKRSKGYLLKN